ncbi:MAG: hypothetical protein AAB821_01700 [Patescibacteria group bacterium]
MHDGPDKFILVYAIIATILAIIIGFVSWSKWSGAETVPVPTAEQVDTVAKKFSS